MNDNNRYDADIELQKAIEERRRRNMDAQAQPIYEDDDDMIIVTQPINTVREVNEETLGRTIVKPLAEVKEEEEAQNKASEEKERKTNKIITYIMVLFISVALIAVALVAGKIVLKDMFKKDNPISEQTPQNKDEPQDGETDAETNQDSDVDQNNGDATDGDADQDGETDSDADIEDNSARIAALNGQKKSYADKIASYEEKIDAAKTANEEAQNVLDNDLKEYEKNIKVQWDTG